MPNRKISLLDLDPLPFIIGYTYRDADEQTIVAQTDSMLYNILSATAAEQYLGFLGGGRCFRYDVAVSRPYKGTRSKEEPDWLQQWKPVICRHLVEHWGAVVCEKVEADDAIGILHQQLTTAGEQVTVCSPDKDLKQLPGQHYDFKKCEHSYWTEEDSARHFWTSMIVGDTADGIPGLPGKGPAFAEKCLQNAQTVEQLRLCVEDAYVNSGILNFRDLFQEQYTLLNMLREPAHGFVVPELLPVPVFDPFLVREVKPQPAKLNTNFMNDLFA